MKAMEKNLIIIGLILAIVFFFAVVSPRLFAPRPPGVQWEKITDKSEESRKIIEKSKADYKAFMEQHKSSLPK